MFPIVALVTNVNGTGRANAVHRMGQSVKQCAVFNRSMQLERKQSFAEVLPRCTRSIGTTVKRLRQKVAKARFARSRHYPVSILLHRKLPPPLPIAPARRQVIKIYHIYCFATSIRLSAHVDGGGCALSWALLAHLKLSRTFTAMFRYFQPPLGDRGAGVARDMINGCAEITLGRMLTLDNFSSSQHRRDAPLSGVAWTKPVPAGIL